MIGLIEACVQHGDDDTFPFVSLIVEILGIHQMQLIEGGP